jgi:SNF2 family DNA or RNA helicase
MAKALLKAEVSTVAAETLAEFWEEANITDYPSWARNIRLAKHPFKHQIADLNHLAQFSRNGLWNEPGVGKTFPSQAHVLWLVANRNKAICTMPPVLVQQFRDSFFASFPGVATHVKIEVFSGNIEKRNQLLEEWNRSGWPDVLVMSYDMFSGKSETEIKSLVRKRVASAEKKGTCPVEAAQLSDSDTADVHLWLKKGYTHLLIDEATAVKTPGSDLHRSAAKFAGKEGPESNGLTLMTGSPVENNITDLYGLIKLITPSRYGSYRAFERIHCVMTYGRFPKLVGFQNEDYAFQSLYLQGRRVLKKDVSDLPPKLITEVQVTLAKPHLDLYKKLVNERVLEIGDEVIDATTASSLYQKMQRLLLCPENFAENWSTKNALVDSLDELVHSLGGRKLLMYVWFNDSIDKLAKHYQHLNPAQLNGSITGKDRDAQKMKFIENDSCRLMLANVRSGGVGIDGWQAVCSHVAFAEVCPIPGAFEQSVGRLHRTGQKAEMINVYMFTPTQTIAVKLRNDLVKKEQTANTAVRDAKTLLFDLLGQEGLQGELE